MSVTVNEPCYHIGVCKFTIWSYHINGINQLSLQR